MVSSALWHLVGTVILTKYLLKEGHPEEVRSELRLGVKDDFMASFAFFVGPASLFTSCTQTNSERL